MGFKVLLTVHGHPSLSNAVLNHTVTHSVQNQSKTKGKIHCVRYGTIYVST